MANILVRKGERDARVVTLKAALNRRYPGQMADTTDLLDDAALKLLDRYRADDWLARAFRPVPDQADIARFPRLPAKIAGSPGLFFDGLDTASWNALTGGEKLAAKRYAVVPVKQRFASTCWQASMLMASGVAVPIKRTYGSDFLNFTNIVGSFVMLPAVFALTTDEILFDGYFNESGAQLSEVDMLVRRCGAGWRKSALAGAADLKPSLLRDALRLSPAMLWFDRIGGAHSVVVAGVRGNDDPQEMAIHIIDPGFNVGVDDDWEGVGYTILLADFLKQFPKVLHLIYRQV